MTWVALPLGRGKVFSANSKLSAELRLIELRYLAKGVGSLTGCTVNSTGRIQGWSNDELLVCMVIRWTTRVISSALKRENMMRSSVWQVTQPASVSFCCWVPGTLRSHSALESCMASFDLLT